MHTDSAPSKLRPFFSEFDLKAEARAFYASFRALSFFRVLSLFSLIKMTRLIALTNDVTAVDLQQFLMVTK